MIVHSVVFVSFCYSNEFQICNMKKTRLFLNVVEIDVLEQNAYRFRKISIDLIYERNKKYRVIERVVCLMEGGWILCSMGVSVSACLINAYPHPNLVL